jgi:hypothetical protein
MVIGVILLKNGVNVSVDETSFGVSIGIGDNAKPELF